MADAPRPAGAPASPPQWRVTLRAVAIIVNTTFFLALGGALLVFGFYVVEEAGIGRAAVQVWRARQGDETLHVDDAATMKAAVLRAVPPGTAIAPAQAEVERRGFRCTPNTATTWLPWWHSSESTGAGPALDFLACWRTDKRSLVMAQTWAIALVHEHGAVTDVLVNTVGEGP